MHDDEVRFEMFEVRVFRVCARMINNAHLLIGETVLLDSIDRNHQLTSNPNRFIASFSFSEVLQMIKGQLGQVINAIFGCVARFV